MLIFTAGRGQQVGEDSFGVWDPHDLRRGVRMVEGALGAELGCLLVERDDLAVAELTLFDILVTNKTFRGFA